MKTAFVENKVVSQTKRFTVTMRSEAVGRAKTCQHIFNFVYSCYWLCSTFYYNEIKKVLKGGWSVRPPAESDRDMSGVGLNKYKLKFIIYIRFQLLVVLLL